MRWFVLAVWVQLSACDGGEIRLGETDTGETGRSGPQDRDRDGYTSAIDCDDRDAAVHPGAEETCNDRDDDCDGTVDEGLGATYYADADGDGYGSQATTTVACAPPTGFVTNAVDCNDSNAAIHPGALEVCDTVDQDCDGSIDEDVRSTYYRDADGDGYGAASVTIQACSVPTGYVTNATDCNDADATVKPGASELCNGADDDCDGSVDEDVADTTWYRDADGDGYGTTSATTKACTKPSGYVSNSTDCDDSRATVHPGATETCNGRDDDCDGAVDEVSGSWTWYRDADGDGFGDATVTTTTTSCTAPTGYVADSGDCDDAASTTYPGAPELCNSKDDDCDGVADDGSSSTWFRDADGDSYGTSADVKTGCTAPSGYVTTSGDCDDTLASVSPGATEVCNERDDDCDGTIDEGVKTTYYRDGDSDGYGDPTYTTQACSRPTGYVADNTDCYDSSAAIRPGAHESCNGIDDDCDGLVDDGCS